MDPLENTGNPPCGDAAVCTDFKGRVKALTCLSYTHTYSYENNHIPQAITMAPSAQAHKRSHSLLLLQKLLNLRDSASPLTLVLDTLEQSATPLIDEFITRAKV